MLLALLLACPPPIIVMEDTTTTDSPQDSEPQDTDPVDFDGDGYPEGVDCDDLDGSVNPGATEIWYDGRDQDCDGNDCDQDNDGVLFDFAICGGTDCDDKNAAIRPDATEVWYDGVDQNCDAWCDWDADKDGFAVDGKTGTDCVEVPLGDCDDAVASTNPDALEYVDGLDSDCDGVEDDLETLDAVTTLQGNGGDFGLWMTTGDADGDAYPEIWVSSPAANTGAGRVARYNGLEIDADVGGTLAWTRAETAIGPNGASAGIGAPMWRLDLDDPGQGRLAIGDPGSGQVLRFNEPTALSTVATSDASVAYFSSSYTVSGGAMGVVRAGADQDALIFLGTPLGSSSSTQGALWLYPTDQAMPASKEINSLPGTRLYLSGNVSDQLGASAVAVDLDGDGKQELLVGMPTADKSDGTPEIGGVVIVDSTTLSDIILGNVGSQKDLSDMALVKGDKAGNQFGQQLFAVGDIDGDGVDDLIASSLIAGKARLHLISGAAAGSKSASQLQRIDVGRSSDLTANYVAAADLNGDGVNDLAIGDGDSQQVLIFLGPLSAASYTAADADAVVNSSAAGFGSSLMFVDSLDADGVVELWVSAPEAVVDGSLEGAVYLLPLAF